MLLDEIGNLLENNGIGIQGSSIFLGDMPGEGPDPLIAVYEYIGMPIERTHTSKYDKSRVQFQVRSLDYSVGKQKIMDVFFVIENVVNRVLDGTMYYRIEPIQAPTFLSRDEENRIIFIFNAQVTQEF